MKPSSRYLVHVAINYVFNPAPSISRQTQMQFQQALEDNGVDYQRIETPGNQLIFARDKPSPLQVVVGTIPDGPFGQILVIGPNLTSSLELFTLETEAVLVACEQVWSIYNCQIIQRDATIRELYETTSEHAFQELWESRLGQSSQSLAAFGKPIRGGGLRFVMDPPAQDINQAQIEVRIESFLRDTSKIYVETQFMWPFSPPHGSSFEPRERLDQVNNFATHEVRNFITGESDD